MLTPEWFKDKNITVMGLGVHGGGLGIARWLRRHGARVTVTDLRDQHALASSIEILERTYLQEVGRRGKHAMHRIRYVLGSHPEELFTKADMVIRNPAVPREHALLALAKKHGVPVESDISLFFMLCPFPITAISGTKGKTTTTMLIAAMCKEMDKRTVIGGNIRISPLDSLDRLLTISKKKNAKPVPVVLELSSWQLEGLEPHRMSPHVGVLTMIAEDHLNRYRDMADYAAAKEIAVAYQGKDDIAVLGADNTWTAAIGRGQGQVADAPNAGTRMWYSVKKLPAGADGCVIEKGKIILKHGGRRVVVAPVSSIGLLGGHNRANILAAVAAAHVMGVPLASIRKVIRTFRGVPYRLETVAIRRGIRFVDDTTATAPDASIAAINTFKGRKKHIVLIAGGADKSLTFDAWAKAVKVGVKHLVLFDGAATEKMEVALGKVGAQAPRAGARSMREALIEAMNHATRGDIVLLSPGCASFGLFKNEFDRGDQFNALVKKMK
jgi:UDP-N-acetylmuramoylalanine--D-glutamate ligase